MKRSPVRKKRPGPPRRGRIRNARYMAWMHETQQPLLLEECGVSELHHVRKRAGDQKDDTRTVMLTTLSHREAKWSVEKVGDRAFQDMFELDFEAEILRCNQQYEQETGRKLAKNPTDRVAQS